MEGGGIVQAYAFAEVRKADTLTMPRDFFQNGKCAPQRLYAAPRTILGLVVDGGLAGLHQPRDRL